MNDIDRNGYLYVYNIHFANYLILNGGVVKGAGINKKTNKIYIVFDYDTTREAYKKFDANKKTYK